jgi:hypothetical protein
VRPVDFPSLKLLELAPSNLGVAGGGYHSNIRVPHVNDLYFLEKKIPTMLTMAGSLKDYSRY